MDKSNRLKTLETSGLVSDRNLGVTFRRRSFDAIRRRSSAGETHFRCSSACHVTHVSRRTVNRETRAILAPRAQRSAALRIEGENIQSEKEDGRIKRRPDAFV